MTEEKENSKFSSLDDIVERDKVKVAFGGAVGHRNVSKDIEEDLERYTNRLTKYWSPLTLAMAPELQETIRNNLNLEGGDNMKVYEIILVDEEGGEILQEKKVVARDKEHALLKIGSFTTEDYSKLVRELGTVS